MSSRKPTNVREGALADFLRAESGPEVDSLLERLISEQTETAIKGVIRSKLRVSLSQSDSSRANQDGLDLLRDVQTSLVAELQGLRSDADGRTIDDLRAYVATITLNACHQYLREKYPRRYQLKNKLRYLLTHRPGLALWEGAGGEVVCGPEAWRDAGREPLRRPQAQTFQGENQRALADLRAAAAADGRGGLFNLVSAIFGRLGEPLILDDLVTLAADLLGLQEPAESANGSGRESQDPYERLPDPEPGVDSTLEQRDRLRKLWAEICLLPPRHRAALLLNLRGAAGECVIGLLPLTRVATVRQIAEALSLPPEQFARVWNELPWDDARIALHLGLTRQQVINLRQSARSRLARRMKDF